MKNKEKIIHIDGSLKHFKVAGVCEQTGKVLFEKFNRKIEWQIEIEAFGLLSALFWAKENNIENLTVKTDCGILVAKDGKFKSKTSAGRYARLAWWIAKQNNIELTVEWIAGSANKADHASRN